MGPGSGGEVRCNSAGNDVANLANRADNRDDLLPFDERSNLSMC